MIVQIPFPPKELSPNKRLDRRSIAGIRAQYRDDCFYLTKQAMGAWEAWESPLCDLKTTITFVQPDMRHRDLDNLLASIKAAVDGIASALGINDRQLKPITVDWKRGEKPGAVVVEITP